MDRQKQQTSPVGGAQPAWAGAGQSGFNDTMRNLMLGLAMGGTPNESMANAAKMMAIGNTQRRKQNATVQWLTGKGVGNQEAAYLARDPVALRAWYGEYQKGSKPDWQIGEIYNDKGQPVKAMIDKRTGKYNVIGGAKAPEQTSDVRDYEFAKSQGFTGSFQDWIASKRAGAGEYGLQPIYGKDAKGNTIIMQLGKAGSAIQSKMPDGVTLSPGVEKIDLGTQWGLFDRRAGAIVGYVPKDVAGEAAEKKFGTGQGEARSTLASVSGKMPGLEIVVKKLDDLAGKATYTYGGQALDEARRQFGMEPRESAIARAEYVSIVDNQILPLLRDTFGAAFTAKEGESLRATLGDPNKSPKEKQAVLRSFIEQKRRNIEALQRQTGQTGVTPPMQSAQPASQVPAPPPGFEMVQ
jgi:hypothetical protein